VNTWGLDLSTSRQGAGGVGGLLARTTSGATRSYTFDGNGNVSELVNSTGTLAGHYEYGPFGQKTAQIDSDASGAVGSNPYRFSTKPLDAESGLYYYGYRYYNPIDGRWINRDPSEEQGGLNLYCFVQNQPVNLIDLFGMVATVPDPDGWPNVCCDKTKDFINALLDTVKERYADLRNDKDLWNNPKAVPRSKGGKGTWQGHVDKYNEQRGRMKGAIQKFDSDKCNGDISEARQWSDMPAPNQPDNIPQPQPQPVPAPSPAPVSPRSPIHIPSIKPPPPWWIIIIPIIPWPGNPIYGGV